MIPPPERPGHPPGPRSRSYQSGSGSIFLEVREQISAADQVAARGRARCTWECAVLDQLTDAAVRDPEDGGGFREVNEAADIYTAALNCAHPHTFPAALAAEEARLKRNAYIRDHYREHTTAVGLLAATAAHLRDLASRTD